MKRLQTSHLRCWRVLLMSFKDLHSVRRTVWNNTVDQRDFCHISSESFNKLFYQAHHARNQGSCFCYTGKTYNILFDTLHQQCERVMGIILMEKRFPPLQGHRHCHVQHGPEPLPVGHSDLLAGDWELWVDISKMYFKNMSNAFNNTTAVWTNDSLIHPPISPVSLSQFRFRIHRKVSSGPSSSSISKLLKNLNLAGSSQIFLLEPSACSEFLCFDAFYRVPSYNFFIPVWETREYFGPNLPVCHNSATI